MAQALARKFGWRIQPGGAAALNLMDISTQVPSRFVYLSDGPNRSYRIGRTTLAFKHQVLKEAGLRHDESAVLVQGLKELGQRLIQRPSIQNYTIPSLTAVPRTVARRSSG